jgi:hypothetical protein
MSVVSQQHLFSSSAMMSGGGGGGGAVDYGGSVSFDGGNDYLDVADNSEFEFGSGNFTLEAFINYTGNPGTGNSTYTIFSKWNNQSSPNDKGFILRISDDGGGDNLQWFYTTDGSTNRITTGNTVLSPNTWYHIAFVRNGSTGRFYINGTQDSTTVSFGGDSIRDTGNNFRIGANLDVGSINQEFNGLISNVRVVKGTAVYTSNFTVPTSPLTAITNTKLLCCQSTTSATVATVDISGLGLYNISGTAGSYAPTGLSGGIDFPSGQGTANNSNGSYILNANTSFGGNYTIEFWFNIDSFGNYAYGTYGAVLFDGRPQSASGDQHLGSIYAANDSGGTNPFNLRYHADGSDWISGSTNLNMGTWHHCALVRNSGTITLYVNGTSEGTYSHSTSMVSNSNRPYVGGWGYIPGVNDFALDGKMSNLRIGSTAVYTSSFTPPTSNLTAISGTTFLGLQSTSSARAFTSPSGVLNATGATASSSHPF